MNDLRTRIADDMERAGVPTSTFEDLVALQVRRRRRERTAAGLVGITVFVAVLLWLGSSIYRATDPDRPATQTVAPLPMLTGTGPLTWVRNGQLVMLEHGSIVRLPLPPQDVVRSFDWSPDGSLIAYTVLTPDLTDWTSSPDRYRNEPCRLKVLDVSDGSVLDLAPCTSVSVIASEPAQDLDWSPDGRSIVYAGLDGLLAINRDGSDARALTHDGGLEPRWLVDGRIGYYTYPDFGAVTIDPDGTDPRPASFGAHWALSPDGERVAYFAGLKREGAYPGARNVWVADADGSDPVKIETTWCCASSRWDLTWSPDSTHVLLSGPKVTSIDVTDPHDPVKRILSVIEPRSTPVAGSDHPSLPSWRPVP